MTRSRAAVLAVLAMVSATPALADGWGLGWHRHPYYWGRHWGPPPVAYVYGPPVMIYAPPPAYVVAAPPPPIQAVPVSPQYTDNAGRFCREYQTTVMVGGQPQASYGTACQQPDGTWRLVN